MDHYSERVPTAEENDECKKNCVIVEKADSICKSCDDTVSIEDGEKNNTLVPVLLDVIQNCICINKCETAYPENLVIRTDLLRGGGKENKKPSGKICLDDAVYSYSVIGIPGGSEGGYKREMPPSINSNIGSHKIILSGTIPFFRCENLKGEHVGIYDEFIGHTITDVYCCDDKPQKYAKAKLIEKDISFVICDLNIAVRGAIGEQKFIGEVIGILSKVHRGGIKKLTQLVTLESLGFTKKFDFAASMNLITNKRITIKESFDTCFSVDCVRPICSIYKAASDPAVNLIPEEKNAVFLAAADLTLKVNKNIYVTSKEKLIINNIESNIIFSEDKIE